MKKIMYMLAVGLCFFVSSHVWAQQVSGIVFERGKAGMKKPISNATIHWIESQKGAVTDNKGYFIIRKTEQDRRLLIRSVGFDADTLEVDSTDYVEIEMHPEQRVLGEVTIKANRGASYISPLNPLNARIMTKVELQKAACCNLSESFETNPSIDVSFSDAATGLKQIQMLGLTGQYIQLTEENKPSMRVLSSISGLTYVPGTWIESIQVVKGIGSVMNGYESITGQINVEQKKPLAKERFYVNMYQNQLGRSEANINFSNKINDKWSLATFAHYNRSWLSVDNNNDGFQDFPLGKQINLAQRWWYQSGGITGQVGARYVDDNRTTAVTSANTTLDPSINSSMHNNKVDVWGKWGYVFPKTKYNSIGLIGYATKHKSDNDIGIRPFNANQNTLYLNSIYQSIIGTSVHQYRTGMSLQLDDVSQKLDENTYNRFERVVGGFVEYTYMPTEKWNLVLGYRLDHNNLFGWIHLPRLHSKWLITDNTTLRLAGGRGVRTSNPIMDNVGLLFSSRTVVYSPKSLQEAAWNYGMNLHQTFRLLGREGNISIDLYRTDFTKQVIINREDAQMLVFENLDGKSYSQYFQIETDYELLKRLNLRLSYRYNDVKATYNQILLQVPLVSKHRVFANVDYQYKNWKVDLTFNWLGSKRLVATTMEASTQSPDYYTMNAQLTRKISKLFDIYLGSENLLGYMQHHLIMYHDAQNFDGTNVWGPTMARNIYLGLRYSLE